MAACVNGHINVVKLLLHYSDGKNIDLNARQGWLDQGPTAIKLARQSGQGKIVKLLQIYSTVKYIDISE